MKIAIFEKNINTKTFANYSANYVILPSNAHADLLITLTKAANIIERYGNQMTDLKQIRVTIIDSECNPNTFNSISLIIKLTTSFNIVVSEIPVAKTKQELLPDFLKQFVDFNYSDFLEVSSDEEDVEEEDIIQYENHKSNLHSFDGSVKSDHLPVQIMIAIDSWTKKW